MELVSGVGSVERIGTVFFVLMIAIAFAAGASAIPFLYMVGVVSGFFAVAVAWRPSTSPASSAAPESAPAAAAASVAREGLLGRYADAGDRAVFDSELDAFVSLVVRDYVEPWYERFAGEDDVRELQALLGSCFTNLARRVLRLDAEKLLCVAAERYRCHLAARHASADRIAQRLHCALARSPVTELQHNKASAAALIRAVAPRRHSRNALLSELLSELLSLRVITPLVDLLSEHEFVLRVARLFSPDADGDRSRSAAASRGSPASDLRRPNAAQFRCAGSGEAQSPASGPVAEDRQRLLLSSSSRHRQQLVGVPERQDLRENRISSELRCNEGPDEQPSQPDEFVSDELAKYFVVAPEAAREVSHSSDSSDGGGAADQLHRRIWRTTSPTPIDSSPGERSHFKLATADSPELFTDVLVTNAQASDDGSTATYTITYKAWYRRSDGSASALRSRTIRKQHQEIVNLHRMLRSHATLQANMTAIGSPTCLRDDVRIVSDPDSVCMLKATVASYLQHVTSDSMLCGSEEVRQFLGCDDDCLTVPIRPADVGIPRFNKVLARTVSGVWDRMTGFSFESKPRNDKQMEETDRTFDELKTRVVVQDCAEKEDEINYTTIKLLKAYIEKAVDSETTTSQIMQEQTKSSAIGSQTGRVAQDRDVITAMPKDDHHHPNALAKAVLEVGLLTLQSCSSSCWLLNEHIVGFMVNDVVASWLEQHLRESLRHYLAIRRLAHYLHLLRDLVDAGNAQQADDDDAASPSWSSPYEKALEALKSAFPGLLRIIVGAATFDRCVRTLLDSFDDKLLNKHLLYCILDDVIAELLSVTDDDKETPI